ncbi:hypothetical protein [Hallella colorans]|uniref:hypothetical protein n=1 Tax=Hallella colorans TaxID=1703337 RepID=UPI0023F17DEF|nr:hypothetical protein [Hallella colorans]
MMYLFCVLALRRISFAAPKRAMTLGLLQANISPRRIICTFCIRQRRSNISLTGAFGVLKFG